MEFSFHEIAFLCFVGSCDVMYFEQV